MTKTLLILRHAKSSWQDDSLTDHERPLNKRGKRAAPRMGELLRDQGLTPDFIISSTARRAKDTVARVTVTADFNGDILWESTLYGGGYHAYTWAIRHAPASVDSVMVVGHNPDLEELVETLTGVVTFMPTAALAQIALPIDFWLDLVIDGGYELTNLWRPKELE